MAKQSKGHPTAITERELERARKLAARKNGVTRAQLADALGINVRRALTVLKRTRIKARILGSEGGKANRTLVYTA